MDHLEEHFCIGVIYVNVDHMEEILNLWLSQLIIFVLICFLQAAEDPAEKFVM